jgi:ankyrin repeat protein
LLRQHPSLIRARSARIHRSTLLHYVAANGIEDFRQKTPPNAVTIARSLLEAGAEVDALSDSYGGGRYQTTMNLLVSSTHPADAGLQPALVDTLVDFGAAINGLDDDSSPLMTAFAFGYRDAAETLARRGARVDSVLAASALGRLDLVREFVVDKHTLRAGVPLVAPAWMSVPPDPKAHIDLAFIWACKFARAAAAEFFLDLGVDVATSDDMTALHWAAANGSLDLMAALIKRGAPLEKENVWGGTVLDSTVYFAVNQPLSGVDYPRALEALIAAGANVSAVTPFPTGHAVIDELLRRYGARPS